MITNSAVVMILSVIVLCLTISSPAKAANKKQNSLSLKLLHRSSIPLFENESFQDFLENNKQSFPRNSNFSASATLFPATTAHLYFINLSIEGSNFNGVLGLGPQLISLMNRDLPQKLSYCVGDIYDKNSQASFLELGNTDDWTVLNAGKYVPLYDREYYRADMECIEFGETCVAIEPDTFKYDHNDPHTGVVFDTGTVYTFLPDVAYDQVTKLVDQVMRSEGFGEPENMDNHMCYHGQRENISDFPLLSFHFVNNDVDLSLRLEKNSLFYNKNNGIFCITMIKSSSKNYHWKNFTIIGLAAQQNHTMLFDLEQLRMSIQYSSCAS